MAIQKSETRLIRTSDDVSTVRQVVRQWAIAIGMNLIDQTKIVTAASELARNVYLYGGGGTLTLQHLNESSREGLRLIFEDKGPGIRDIELAMKDGFTTGNGLGLGLGGSKRLVNEFEISSALGIGTKVTITRWKL